MTPPRDALELRDEDLEVHAWPPQPRGGQQVASYYAGVLLIHKPTGMAVVVTEEERSLIKCKAKALSRLKVLLAQAEQVEVLRKLLHWLDEVGGLGHDVHERIRAALTASAGKEGK